MQLPAQTEENSLSFIGQKFKWEIVWEFVKNCSYKRKYADNEQEYSYTSFNVPNRKSPIDFENAVWWHVYLKIV